MNIHSRRIKHLLDQRLLQFRVLRFKRLQPLRIGNRQTVEFRLSGMRRTFRHAVPAEQIGTLRACFMLVQHAVHDRPFQEEVLPPGIMPFYMTGFGFSSASRKDTALKEAAETERL